MKWLFRHFDFYFILLSLLLLFIAQSVSKVMSGHVITLK